MILWLLIWTFQCSLFSLHGIPKQSRQKVIFTLSSSCLNGCVGLWSQRLQGSKLFWFFSKIPFMHVEYMEENELKVSWECRSVVEHFHSTRRILPCIARIQDTHPTPLVPRDDLGNHEACFIVSRMWIMFSEKQSFLAEMASLLKDHSSILWNSCESAHLPNPGG